MSLSLSLFLFAALAGESGLGKSTLINSMFLSEIYNKEQHPGPSQRAKKTVAVDTTKVLLKENSVNLSLTIVDTPGFGDAVDNSNWYVICNCFFYLLLALPPCTVGIIFCFSLFLILLLLLQLGAGYRLYREQVRRVFDGRVARTEESDHGQSSALLSVLYRTVRTWTEAARRGVYAAAVRQGEHNSCNCQSGHDDSGGGAIVQEAGNVAATDQEEQSEMRHFLT